MGTNADLISQIKDYCFWPAANAKLSDTRILSLASGRIQGLIFPIVLRAMGGYRIETDDQLIIADQREYRIPYRAHAGRLTDVTVVDQTLGTNRETETSIALVDISDLGDRIYRYAGNYSNAGAYSRARFYFRGDFIGLDPPPDVTRDTLRQRFYIRPGKLVDSTPGTEVGLITDITGNTITCSDGIPTAMQSVGVLIDTISARGTYPTLAFDQAVAAPTATTIDLAEIPTDLAVGDYLTFADESPVPQVPDAVHELLAAVTAQRCLRTAGDRKNAAALTDEIKDLKLEAIELLGDRVDGEDEAIINHHTPLRSFGGIGGRP